MIRLIFSMAPTSDNLAGNVCLPARTGRQSNPKGGTLLLLGAPGLSHRIQFGQDVFGALLVVHKAVCGSELLLEEGLVFRGRRHLLEGVGEDLDLLRVRSGLYRNGTELGQADIVAEFLGAGDIFEGREAL